MDIGAAAELERAAPQNATHVRQTERGAMCQGRVMRLLVADPDCSAARALRLPDAPCFPRRRSCCSSSSSHRRRRLLPPASAARAAAAAQAAAAQAAAAQAAAAAAALTVVGDRDGTAGSRDLRRDQVIDAGGAADRHRNSADHGMSTTARPAPVRHWRGAAAAAASAPGWPPRLGLHAGPPYLHATILLYYNSNTKF